MDKNVIDYTTSPTSGASPGFSPYYNRTFWAAYKGMARGQLGGIFLGGLMGLGVGLVVSAGAFAVLPATFGLAAAGLTSLASTAIGMKYYYGVMRDVGNVAGAISAAMEVNEERATVLNIKLDTIVNAMAREGHLSKDEISHIQDQVESVYQQGEAKYEKKFFQKPTVIWQVAAVGALAGMALVGAIAVGGQYILGEALGHALGGAAGLSMPALLGIGLAGGGIAGASYGINRDKIRPIVNFTNALFEGDLKELERQKETQKTIPLETSIETNIVATNGAEEKRLAGLQGPSPRISSGMTVLLGTDASQAMRHPKAAETAGGFKARVEAERAQAAPEGPTIH